VQFGSGVGVGRRLAERETYLGDEGLIQITPDRRILLSIEPFDGRKGIDSITPPTFGMRPADAGYCPLR
jgi:hypothetical protein